MKRIFRVEKIAVESLLNLLSDLYEKGVDFVDLTADHSDPKHDKLIIITKDEYINPEALKAREEDDDDDDDFMPKQQEDDDDTPTLSDEDINELL